MAFDDQEQHAHGGAPQEFFKFSSGATVWRWTSGDAAETINDGASSEYTPAAISASPMDHSREDSAGNITVRMARDNAVAALFVAYTPPDPVSLVIYTKHRADAELRVAFVGEVSAASFGGGEARLTCSPITQRMKRSVPKVVVQSQCNWALYGTGCGVDAETYKVEGAVDTVTGSVVSVSEFDALADGYFNAGWLEVVATGERRYIVSHVGAAVTLMSPISGLAPADDVIAYPGCERTEAVCASKFNNLLNHLGFARVPTRNPYDGSIV